MSTPMSLAAAAMGGRASAPVETPDATQMRQHIGEQRGTAGSAREAKAVPALGKPRIRRAGDGGLVGLMTRRS